MAPFPKNLKKVRVNSAFVTHCSADWSWDCRRRRLKDFDLWYITAGRGRLETPEGEFIIGEGDCFILRPQQRYFGRHDPTDPLSVTAVHFDYLNSRGRVVLPPAETLDPLHRRMRDTAFMSQLLQRVILAFGYGAADKSRADEWLAAVLLEVRHRDHQPSLPPHQQAQLQCIDRLCGEISANPASDYSLSRLAGRLACSPDHFARVFRRYKGLSPGDFIIRNRIEAAKTLLLNSNHSITRIAELLGYSDVYYFSKQFRRKTRRTPSEFRNFTGD